MATVPEIPRIIHQIWLGPSVPAWLITFRQDLLKLHKGWDLRLTRAIPPEMDSDLALLIAKCPYICQQADILRYWLLYKYGGLYLDADIVPYRNMEDLRKYSAFAVRQPDSRIACGALGCVKGHASFAYILDEVRKRNPDERTVFGPDLLTGKQSSLIEKGMRALPSYYFYPSRNKRVCYRFWRAGPKARQSWIVAGRRQYADGVVPFGVHLWGVAGSSNKRVSKHVL